MKKKKNILHRLTHLIAWFMGSWWGILVHTIWLYFWFLLRLDIFLLTLILSIEAIFIGIFLLMVGNEAETAREKRDKLSRTRTMKILNQDLVLDERAERRQKEIMRRLRGIEKEIASLKKSSPKSP